MYPIKNEEILEVAVEASLAASDIIMEAAHNPLIKKVKKSDSDLVTHTDLESEKIIKNLEAIGGLLQMMLDLSGIDRERCKLDIAKMIGMVNL